MIVKFNLDQQLKRKPVPIVFALDIAHYHRYKEYCFSINWKLITSHFSCVIIKETQRRQYEGHNTPLGYYTNQDPSGRGQYDDEGVYWGLSTASEVFLIFTTQLYKFFSAFFS